ncbi:hypothetical protein [Streptomyces antarcticus]|uniref:hypothetical protein n=1 Tax=Streptomyces antarcticus TaxID=2996458 RepID=UPI00226DDA2C|nr:MULTISPECIES: hypothetical protein [unclassified Streptomyces]MCY0944349.1 hypothetical protein [Streptomyces sp. H34-AA3]MCZ4087681.1 hypothetical protein [Streptomyces sp. H34-S5]
MIFAVLLVPPFLLCVLLALDRYEERMFDPRGAGSAPRRRHLRALPASGGRHAAEPARRGRHGRHAA